MKSGKWNYKSGEWRENKKEKNHRRCRSAVSADGVCVPVCRFVQHERGGVLICAFRKGHGSQCPHCAQYPSSEDIGGGHCRGGAFPLRAYHADKSASISSSKLLIPFLPKTVFSSTVNEYKDT